MIVDKILVLVCLKNTSDIGPKEYDISVAYAEPTSPNLGIHMIFSIMFNTIGKKDLKRRIFLKFSVIR